MVEFIDSLNDLHMKKIQDLELVNIGYEDCRSGYGYGPTLRPYHLIHFVTKGEGTLTISGNSFSIRAGDAFFIPAEQVSYYEASKYNPWSYSWIGFMGTQADNISREIMTSCLERYVIRNLDVELYKTLIKEGAELKDLNIQNHFLVRSILLRIMSNLYDSILMKKQAVYSISLVDEIKFYFDSKYTENTQIQQIANIFGIHPNYMNQVFREKYGISPKQYLTRLKLDKAKSMLSSTNLPVALIAASLGFTDQLSFSRIFKSKIGMPPTVYRKEFRCDNDRADV